MAVSHGSSEFDSQEHTGSQLPVATFGPPAGMSAA